MAKCERSWRSQEINEGHGDIGERVTCRPHGDKKVRRE
jgi:hypothetical protein